mmetsp:Transcript_996/g.2082  ORF Transcript_996/g.2082 Transcript_996/m.2082 type:complete len:216 (-) Transcript_996:2053-2700(-)
MAARDVGRKAFIPSTPGSGITSPSGAGARGRGGKLLPSSTGETAAPPTPFAVPGVGRLVVRPKATVLSDRWSVAGDLACRRGAPWSLLLEGGEQGESLPPLPVAGPPRPALDRLLPAALAGFLAAVDMRLQLACPCSSLHTAGGALRTFAMTLTACCSSPAPPAGRPEPAPAPPSPLLPANKYPPSSSPKTSLPISSKLSPFAFAATFSLTSASR